MVFSKKKKKKKKRPPPYSESYYGHTRGDEEIREETDTFLFGGHDTVTANICWALFLLGNHVHVQAKVQQELDEIFLGLERAVTKQDVAEMKYLELVIKETLRLYPSVPYIGRMLGENIQIDNYQIPKNTRISIHIYEMHRNPQYYPNPNEFNPDNFLPENTINRHPYAYIPFSAGARNCVGQKFAMLEIKVLLAMILRKFTIKSTLSMAECKFDGTMTLKARDGFKVTLSAR